MRREHACYRVQCSAPVLCGDYKASIVSIYEKYSSLSSSTYHTHILLVHRDQSRRRQQQTQARRPSCRSTVASHRRDSTVSRSTFHCSSRNYEHVCFIVGNLFIHRNQFNLTALLWINYKSQRVQLAIGTNLPLPFSVVT